MNASLRGNFVRVGRRIWWVEGKTVHEGTIKEVGSPALSVRVDEKDTGRELVLKVGDIYFSLEALHAANRNIDTD